MSDNIELIFKNDRLGEIIGRAMASRQFGKYDYDGITVQQSGEQIIGTYALDMVVNSYEVNAGLDFTCATLDRLPVVMRRNLLGYMENGNPFHSSVERTAKSFAAYLYCLAMNEHNCAWNVTRVRTIILPPDADLGPLWANALRITTGEQRQMDLLAAVMEGCNAVTRNDKGLMLVAVGPIVRTYRRAFGVDLSEYGLVDMALEADVE